MSLKDDAYERQPGRTARACAPVVQGMQIVCAVTMDDRQLDCEYLRLSQSGCFGRTSVSIVWYHSKASHSLQL